MDTNKTSAKNHIDFGVKSLGVLFLLLLILCSCSNNNQQIPSAETSVASISSTVKRETTSEHEPNIAEDSEASNTNNIVELTEKDFNRLFTLSKDDILKYFGNEYEIVDDNEFVQDGYFFEKYSLTITFDDNNLISAIYCGDKVSIDGAKKGMAFNSIMEKLGKTDIEEIVFISDYAYRISYNMKQYIVTFTSYDKTGDDSMLIIYNAE